MLERARRPTIITIPSSDTTFGAYVERLQAQDRVRDPSALEARLRQMFPRVVVRERALWGEAPAWYVYRDGHWQPSADGPWWQAVGVPRIVVSEAGWVTALNPSAAGLLGVDASEIHDRHFTDFVPAGTLGDAESLFGLINEGRDLTATIRLRPTSGDVIAVDIHAEPAPEGVIGHFRLAGDVDHSVPDLTAPKPEVVCEPLADAAFVGYVRLALSRMPEPSPEGLALRLRRLYPHAHVRVGTGGWVASRDPEAGQSLPVDWWLQDDLPLVRYDQRALIQEANQAAVDLLGQPLVGHHWQEFVTPGSSDEVAAMLDILAKAGAADSRFRMPTADGSLLEFDSHTQVDGETFTTVMRPRPKESDAEGAASLG
jgi:PAS domain-containing protein